MSKAVSVSLLQVCSERNTLIPRKAFLQGFMHGPEDVSITLKDLLSVTGPASYPVMNNNKEEEAFLSHRLRKEALINQEAGAGAFSG